MCRFKRILVQINSLLSALLRDHWLIEPNRGEAYFPLVHSILSGQSRDTSTEKPKALSYMPIMETGNETGFSEDKPEGDAIMKVRLNGPMLKYGGLCNYGTMDYVAWIKEANQNPEIGGILLEVDSPGGQASGVDLLREVIASSEKPVMVQINGLMASAAAYSMIGGTKIYASSKSDMIGSFGGLISFKDYSKAMERMGIKTVTVYAPQSTEKNIEAEEAIKGNTKLLKKELGALIDIHHQAVRDLRNLSSDSWETGRMFFAEEALSIGLIDGIQNIDETVNQLLSLIQTNNNSSQMFNKHKKLSALAGIAEADLTEAQLTEVNDELDGQKIEAVRVVPASFVAEADNAIAEKNLAVKAKQDAEAALTVANTDRDNWKAKAEAYGKQPGATPTALEKKDETKVESNKTQLISETDKELMEARGQIFTVA